MTDDSSTFFLSLKLPSYMVVSVREIRNIFTSFSSNMNLTQNYCLPTVYQDNDTGMDILKGKSPDNYNKVRGRLFSHNSSISRDNSMSSTKSSVAYHERMEQNNGMDVDNLPNKDLSLELSYETTQEKTLCFSKVAENQTNMRPTQVNLTSNTCPQHDFANHPNSTPSYRSTVQNEGSAFINILLLYNPNAPTDPKI